MEEQTVQSPRVFNWMALTKPKNIVLILLGFVAFLFVSTGVLSLFNQMSGVTQSTSYDSFGGGVSEESFLAPNVGLSNKSAGVASRSEIARPSSDVVGGVGSYDEALYETRSYSATFKTGDLDTVCNTIESWKPRQSVVFEQASRSDRTCSYRFKVPHAEADAMLVSLNALHPNELTVDTESVKKQMVEYDGALDILLRKQALLESMLEESVVAYDELITLSKSVENVKVLAGVIESKLAQIEQLTGQRLALSAELQQLSRTMGELEDRVAFAYFNVFVQQYDIVDGDAILDSWVAATREFAYGINELVQHLTLGLILNLFAAVQVLVYLVILLVVVKFGWQIVRRFWQS